MTALTTVVDGNIIYAAEINQYRSLSVGGAIFDVKAGYSAAGDGVTDDTAAIQAAIDAAYAASGGIVFFPPGDYLIGTPGLVIPESSQIGIMLQGSGAGGTPVTSQGTRLVRDAAHSILSAVGTGATSATKSHGLRVRDMTMDGAAFAADMVLLDHAAGGSFDSVRLTNSTLCAVTSHQLHNFRFTNCNFEMSGDAATTTPAVYLGCPDADEQTSGVMFDNCNFENNLYDDVELAGAAENARMCLGVIFTNCRWEGNVAGYCVFLSGAMGCSIVGGHMTQLYTNAQPMVMQSAGCYLNSLVGVFFHDYEVDPTFPSTADYAVELQGGAYTTITGCAFWGSKTAHIRLDVGCGEVSIGPNMHHITGVATAASVSDARATGAGIITPNAGALGTTAADSILAMSIGGQTANTEALGVRLIRTTNGADWTTTSIRLSMDVDNVPYVGAWMDLMAGGVVALSKLGVNNAVAATTLGTLDSKMEVFNAAGVSIGFVPIYHAIT